jgi:hypothetical protein
MLDRGGSAFRGRRGKLNLVPGVFRACLAFGVIRATGRKSSLSVRLITGEECAIFSLFRFISHFRSS